MKTTMTQTVTAMGAASQPSRAKSPALIAAPPVALAARPRCGSDMALSPSIIIIATPSAISPSRFPAGAMSMPVSSAPNHQATRRRMTLKRFRRARFSSKPGAASLTRTDRCIAMMAHQPTRMSAVNAGLVCGPTSSSSSASRTASSSDSGKLRR